MAYFRMAHFRMTRGLIVALAAMGTVAPAAPPVIKNQGYIPFGDAPIDYRSEDLHDPVARLQQRMDRGEVRLKYEAHQSYLRSVLDALKIPVNSQTLVYSKTSFQYPKISPDKPRALYFNDDVYVGRVQDGMALEFVSFDAMQGAIFYILDEHNVEKPRFERANLDCIQCHISNTQTKGVPGVMVRSIFTSPSGTQAGGTTAWVSGHDSPLEQRWGGWFVTGTTRQPHMGKTALPDTSFYLTGTSDVVAHMVLDHQTQMHNLITLTNYQTRLALQSGSPAAKRQYERSAEQLVRYLLFANEARLEGPVSGGSGYAEEFAARGLRDPKGRSLRDFDLRTRLFKYPCSYLIYTEAFDAVPEPAKEFIWSRMLEVLSGRDQTPEFAALSPEDRRAVLEILVATKPGLPAAWRQTASTNLDRSSKP